MTATLYRSLDSNGDYSFGRGLQDFLQGAAAVAQAVQTRLLLLRGELWEDTSAGLPLFQEILSRRGAPQNLQTADLLIQEQVTGTDGVASLSNYQRSYVDRKLSVSCQITTTSGETTTVGVTY